MKKLLTEHSKLKTHQIKKWLKQKVQYDKFKEPSATDSPDQANQNSRMPQIKKQYLMSEQEINQDAIIELLFTKFDEDGSGALDSGEIVDLFK